MTDTPDRSLIFRLFNEIGIIEQLSRTMLEARLPDGLIAPHFTILNHLIRVRDGATPMEMARAFQIPKTSVTHTVGVLDRRGLVSVRPNPNDRRSKCVWLTDAGRALRDQVIADLEPDFAGMLAGLDLNDLAAIVPVLTNLREVMDHHRNAEPPRDRPVPPRKP